MSIGADFGVLLLGIVIFVVYLFLQHILARALGGKGSYVQLGYLSAAYTAPLILVSGLLSGIGGFIAASNLPAPAITLGWSFTASGLPSSIPWFFGISLLLSFVLFWFSSIALRAVYELNRWQAFSAALVPMILSVCAASSLSGFAWMQNSLMEMSHAKEHLAIYVMDSDGGHLTRLTGGPADDLLPVWSPDGKRLAFVSDRDGNMEIYVMNADGSGVTRLTNNSATDGDPAWSPDGKRIAFDSDRDGNREVYVMNADGNRQIRLTDNPADDGSPTWSPDGKRMAFSSTREGLNRIYIMNADGGGLTCLTEGEANDMWPIWSPQGTEIAFISDRDNSFWYKNDEIYTMNVNGRNQTNITHYPGQDSIPSWSPDGKQIVFSSRRESQ